jgi:hypothetical protein
MTRRAPFAPICGLAAIGFAIMIVAGNAVAVPAGLPTTGAELADVVTFFATEGTLLGIASALAPAAWMLATMFGAGVVAATWRSERDRGEAWSLVGFAGLVLQNAAFAGVVAIRLALTSTAAHDLDVTAGLWALHETLFTLNGAFLALALVGLSIGGRNAGLVRRWHATLGLLSAVLLFGSATLAPLVVGPAGPLGLLGLVGWLLWVAWIVTYGLTLIRPAPRRALPT